MVDDTLIVVTADHGENLGETDEMGRQRMGHEASVSESALHVPLILAHPEVRGKKVSEPVSVSHLYDLFLDDPLDAVDSGSGVSEILLNEDIVASEYPATGGLEETADSYPDAPEDAIRHRSTEQSCVVYEEAWRLVVESTGDRRSWKSGVETEFSDAPEELTETAEELLENLSGGSDPDTLSNEQVSQLESLGYI
jgi:arylsulfatase A-like enzyme